jgi:hypothetical protein
MLILALACAPAATDSADTTRDMRVTEDDVGALESNQFLLEGPDTVIDPGSDVMVCVFGTYTGPTVGMHDVFTHQAPGGHHLQLMGTGTPAADIPDGTVMDCTGDGGQFQMADMEPVGVTNGGSVDGEEIGVSMPLPDGMAFELESGQRYVMQSHYINTGTEPMRVRDLAVVTTIPVEEVDATGTWAAPLIYNRSDFVIPAGGEIETRFDCTTEKDWNIIYVLGHMHEWGTRFSVERKDGEAWTKFYDIPEWDPMYRDKPEIAYYPDDSMPVSMGTTFKTTCAWQNDKDEDLVFPHEMCVTVNIVYPQKTTVICDGNA